MATYGRKKRALLSAFSVFQDEKDKSDGSESATAYSHLPTTKSIGREPSQHDLLREDDSIDDLASALLDDTSEDLMRAPTQSHASLANGSYSVARNVTPNLLDKPLPLTPHDLQGLELSPSRSATAALMHNENNAKVIRRDRKAFKRSISHPIQLVSDPGNTEQLQRSSTSASAAKPYVTTAGAPNLSNKISNLITTTNSEALETPQYKDDTNSIVDRRARRLQRGKDVFVKAGRVIADRFSNSAEKSARRGLNGSNLLPASNDRTPHRELEADDEATRKRMNRRIAEGTNLSNPKIRSLTGDGNVPRKPLPVYESMKKLGLTDASEEGTCSGDYYHAKDGSIRHGFSGLNIDFGKRKARPVSMQEPLIFPNDTRELTGDVSPYDTEHTSRFSEAISGLAQHPDVDFFSSSPDGYSTPRIRLEPTYGANGKRMLTTVQSGTPSLLDFSFEDNDHDTSADELAIPLSTRVNKSLSLKRKTAKDDLRTVARRPAKKPKRIPMISREDMILATGIGKLDTKDTGALGPKDANKKLGGLGREGNKGKGLNIFDSAKTKEAKSPRTEAAKKLRRRESKRSSTPRPTGRPSGRDRRASSALMTRSKSGDVMDVDELQLDLSDYNVGVKKG
ncbi:MAG: hypothetical protein M1830_006435 [Pleopsidium flavum]|nr:MAG: hypothetical protein M1830_006435 [Pleopsidium flavum]